MLVHTFVTSRLDCYNSFLLGYPQAEFMQGNQRPGSILSGGAFNSITPIQQTSILWFFCTAVLLKIDPECINAPNGTKAKADFTSAIPVGTTWQPTSLAYSQQHCLVLEKINGVDLDRRSPTLIKPDPVSLYHRGLVHFSVFVLSSFLSRLNFPC